MVSFSPARAKKRGKMLGLCKKFLNFVPLMCLKHAINETNFKLTLIIN